MVLTTEKLQDVCKKILDAVDTNSALLVSSSLELKTVGNKLYLNVTNKEYYVSISIDLEGEVEEFRAVVDATLFLNLIAKITTENIELSIVNESLTIKGNGTYKLPMITDTNGIIEVPKITIENVTNEFVMSNENLQNILNFNTKEVIKNVVSRPVQKMYYLDNQGCITFTNSACVNNFSLDTEVKLFISILKESLVDYTMKQVEQFKVQSCNKALKDVAYAGYITDNEYDDAKEYIYTVMEKMFKEYYSAIINNFISKEDKIDELQNQSKIITDFVISVNNDLVDSIVQEFAKANKKNIK